MPAKIFDTKGEMVMSQTVKNENLDVAHLHSGLYVISLVDNDQVYTVRFIKLWKSEKRTLSLIHCIYQLL